MKLIHTLACLALLLFFQKTEAQTDASRLGADAFFTRGLEAHRQNDLKKAIEYYSAALDRDPQHAVARFNRAMAYFSRDQWTKSADDLDLFLRQKPRDRDALERRGYVAYLLKRYDEADEFYGRALQIAESARLRTNRGIALLDGKNPERAIEDFEEALRLDSVFTEAWVGLGNAFMAMNEYENARVIFSEAVTAGISDPRLPFNLGIAQARLGLYKSAIRQFDQVIENAPSAAALAQRAYCFFKLDDFDRARRDALSANNLDVRNALAYNTLGLLELHNENYEVAENTFSEALAWDAKQSEVLAGRGFTRYKMGRYLEAMDDLDAAILTDPGNGQAHYTRAAVKLMLGNKTGACSDYRRALELDFEPFTEEDGSGFCDNFSEGMEPKREEMEH